MAGTDDAAAKRAADAFELADRWERRRASESAQAAVLVADFARAALAAGLTTERLQARTYSGAPGLRTQVVGWYLKRDRSVGVGTDGLFYLLHAEGGLRARIKGVVVPPADPPLELGRGARDGESIPLADALAQRLAAGNAWG